MAVVLNQPPPPPYGAVGPQYIPNHQIYQVPMSARVVTALAALPKTPTLPTPPASTSNADQVAYMQRAAAYAQAPATETTELCGTYMIGRRQKPHMDVYVFREGAPIPAGLGIKEFLTLPPKEFDLKYASIQKAQLASAAASEKMLQSIARFNVMQAEREANAQQLIAAQQRAAAAAAAMAQSKAVIANADAKLASLGKQVAAVESEEAELLRQLAELENVPPTAPSGNQSAAAKAQPKAGVPQTSAASAAAAKPTPMAAAKPAPAPAPKKSVAELMADMDKDAAELARLLGQQPQAAALQASAASAAAVKPTPMAAAKPASVPAPKKSLEELRAATDRETAELARLLAE